MQERKTALLELYAHLWWNLEMVHTQIGNDVPVFILKRAPHYCSPLGINPDSNAQATWFNPDTATSVLDLVQRAVPLFQQDGCDWILRSIC